jgi:hypothetical protein
MIRNILILCLFCAIFSGIAFCQNEIEIDSQVVSINPDGEYIVIKAGEIDGVEIGDALIVHRDGEKLAEAQVVEVRPEVAAAEILNAEKEIKEGDSILIVKKIKEKRTSPEPKKSKWTTILGSGADISSAVPVETVTSSFRAGIETSMPGRIQAGPKSSVTRVNIDADPGTVFSYALMVLRENGYSVISSSRITGAILATKPIELSLMKELWADATARIEHKLVISLEIKNNDGASELSVSGFKEHTQKGKQVKFSIARESTYYADLVQLVSKIKERAGF